MQCVGRLTVSGTAEVLMTDRATDPLTPATTSGYLYVLNGALKYKGGAGTTTTLATA